MGSDEKTVLSNFALSYDLRQRRRIRPFLCGKSVCVDDFVRNLLSSHNTTAYRIPNPDRKPENVEFIESSSELSEWLKLKIRS